MSSTATSLLPAPWKAVKDPKSGREYYFNSETNKTQWEMPVVSEEPSVQPTTTTTTRATEPETTRVKKHDPVVAAPQRQPVAASSVSMSRTSVGSTASATTSGDTVAEIQDEAIADLSRLLSKATKEHSSTSTKLSTSENEKKICEQQLAETRQQLADAIVEVGELKEDKTVLVAKCGEADEKLTNTFTFLEELKVKASRFEAELQKTEQERDLVMNKVEEAKETIEALQDACVDAEKATLAAESSLKSKESELKKAKRLLQPCGPWSLPALFPRDQAIASRVVVLEDSVPRGEVRYRLQAASPSSTTSSSSQGAEDQQQQQQVIPQFALVASEQTIEDVCRSQYFINAPIRLMMAPPLSPETNEYDLDHEINLHLSPGPNSAPNNMSPLPSALSARFQVMQQHQILQNGLLSSNQQDPEGPFLVFAAATASSQGDQGELSDMASAGALKKAISSVNATALGKSHFVFRIDVENTIAPTPPSLGMFYGAQTLLEECHRRYGRGLVQNSASAGGSFGLALLLDANMHSIEVHSPLLSSFGLVDFGSGVGSASGSLNYPGTTSSSPSSHHHGPGGSAGLSVSYSSNTAAVSAEGITVQSSLSSTCAEGSSVVVPVNVASRLLSGLLRGVGRVNSTHGSPPIAVSPYSYEDLFAPDALAEMVEGINAGEGDGDGEASDLKKKFKIRKTMAAEQFLLYEITKTEEITSSRMDVENGKLRKLMGCYYRSRPAMAQDESSNRSVLIKKYPYAPWMWSYLNFALLELPQLPATFDPGHYGEDGNSNKPFCCWTGDALDQKFGGKEGIFHDTELRQIAAKLPEIVSAISSATFGGLTGKTVVDVGFGTGIVAEKIIPQLGPNGRFYGTEVSGGFIELAASSPDKSKFLRMFSTEDPPPRELSEEEEADSLANTPVRDRESYDISQLPVVTLVHTATDSLAGVPSAVADVVLISDVYHHFSYPLASMIEVARILKPMTGIVVIVDFYRDVKKHTSHPENKNWVYEHVRGDLSTFQQEIASLGLFTCMGELPNAPEGENYFTVYRRKETATTTTAAIPGGKTAATGTTQQDFSSPTPQKLRGLY